MSMELLGARNLALFYGEADAEPVLSPAPGGDRHDPALDRDR